MSATDDQRQYGAVVECPHAERCGGCPVIGLEYGDQLALKKGRVVQSLGRYTDLNALHTNEVMAADPIVGYRTRAKLIVASGPKLGLFAKGGGHQVVDIPECRVLSAPLAELAAVLRARFTADELDGGVLAPFDPSGNGMIRAVDLREISGEAGLQTILTLVVERSRSIGRDAELKAAGEALMAAVPTLAGVAINYHDGISPQVLGSETREG
ncbi:MAG: RNA methyltransferase, partial [Proteobacteria bacterium]